MAQNIYDDPEFFARYSQIPRQVRGLAGAPEWPSLERMLPGLAGRRVVDLGCGFGWFARWARGQGAASVLGVDLAENMLARARAETADAEIAYRRADLETLELPAGAFDVAYSALAFHYVADFGRLAGMVHRALVPGGRLVFSIEHPIYMAAAHPRWEADEDGRKTWPVNGYGREGRRQAEWLGRRVVKYHRGLGTTVNTLIGAGFAVRRVEEFVPTAEQVAADASLAEEVERPMLLLVACGRE